MADTYYLLNDYSTEAAFLSGTGLTVDGAEVRTTFSHSGSTSFLTQNITPSAFQPAAGVNYLRTHDQKYSWVGMKSTIFDLPYPLGSLPTVTWPLTRSQYCSLITTGGAGVAMEQDCKRYSGDSTTTSGVTYRLVASGLGTDFDITSGSYPFLTHADAEVRLVVGASGFGVEVKAVGATDFTMVLSALCAVPLSWHYAEWGLSLECLEPTLGFVLQSTQDIVLSWSTGNATYYTPNITGVAGTTATKFSTPGV